MPIMAIAGQVDPLIIGSDDNIVVGDD